MSAQDAITALLLADAGLTAHVGTRVHWMRLPVTVKALPYLNIQVVDDPLFYLHGAGISSYRETALQCDVWAETYTGARDAAAALIAAVSGFRGTIGNVVIRGVFVTGQRDFEGSLTGGERQLFRRNVDLKTCWQEI